MRIGRIRASVASGCLAVATRFGMWPGTVTLAREPRRKKERAMGKRASRLTFVLTAIGVAVQGCSSASDTATDRASVPAHVCRWSCIQQYRDVTTCTELTPDTTATDWNTQCIDDTACEQLPPAPGFNNEGLIPCSSYTDYRNRDYVGSCDDWRAAGSPAFTVPPKNDGAPCGGDVECLSNNCVAYGIGTFLCADPCMMGGCSAGFGCMGGYCFPTQTPDPGGAATLFDGDYCESNAKCISGNCVTQDNKFFYCADLCTSGQCSENYQCVGGYCVFACPSVGT